MPQKILANRPGPETRSVKQLCLEAAKFHHQGGRSDDMLASLDRLLDVTDKIQFLLQRGHVTLAAPIMAQNGTLSYLFLWCAGVQIIKKCMQFFNVLRRVCFVVHAQNYIFINFVHPCFLYNKLDGYPASLGFPRPTMHQVHAIIAIT